MKRTLATVFLCLLLATPACTGVEEDIASKPSDFYRGLAAYKSADYATALREFRPLAEQGHATAQYNLGQMYRLGQGVPRDYGEAVRWFRKAVKQDELDRGDTHRELALQLRYSLGVMYENGWGVPRHYGYAVMWYREAAGRGVVGAQSNLGNIYANGWGERQDYDVAVLLYLQAAEQGHAAAQSNLGVMYQNGQGVARDYVQAHKWFSLGASKGDKTALEKRDIVAKKMTPAQIAEAERLARDWWAAFNKRKGK